MYGSTWEGKLQLGRSINGAFGKYARLHRVRMNDRVGGRRHGIREGVHGGSFDPGSEGAGEEQTRWGRKTSEDGFEERARKSKKEQKKEPKEEKCHVLS